MRIILFLFLYLGIYLFSVMSLLLNYNIFLQNNIMYNINTIRIFHYLETLLLRKLLLLFSLLLVLMLIVNIIYRLVLETYHLDKRFHFLKVIHYTNLLENPIHQKLRECNIFFHRSNIVFPLGIVILNSIFIPRSPNVLILIFSRYVK